MRFVFSINNSSSDKVQVCVPMATPEEFHSHSAKRHLHGKSATVSLRNAQDSTLTRHWGHNSRYTGFFNEQCCRRDTGLIPIPYFPPLCLAPSSTHQEKLGKDERGRSKDVSSKARQLQTRWIVYTSQIPPDALVFPRKKVLNFCFYFTAFTRLITTGSKTLKFHFIYSFKREK